MSFLRVIKFKNSGMETFSMDFFSVVFIFQLRIYLNVCKFAVLTLFLCISILYFMLRSCAHNDVFLRPTLQNHFLKICTLNIIMLSVFSKENISEKSLYQNKLHLVSHFLINYIFICTPLILAKRPILPLYHIKTVLRYLLC